MCLTQVIGYYKVFVAKGTKNPLLWSLYNTFFWEVMWLFAIEFLFCLALMPEPIILKYFFAELSSEGSVSNAVTLACLFCFINFVRNNARYHKEILKCLNGEKCKSTIKALIFRKVTVSSKATNKNYEEG